MPITFRPGRRPPDWTRDRLILGPHLDIEAILNAPPAANWDTRAGTFGMLLNDQLGDCGEAAALHAAQAITSAAGSPVVPSDNDALLAYEKVAGYVPGNPNTDQGTVLQDLFDYWRKTGLSIGGKVHQIYAFASVDITSPLEMQAAVALFGSVIFGVNLPQSAEDAFNRNQVWDYVPGSPILGGHAIDVQRYDQSLWYPVTWGAEWEATPAFVGAYLEEAWVPILPEWVEANGSTPSGLNLTSLGADFTALTGQPAPWAVGPTPVPPSPTPSALVAAVSALAADTNAVTWLLTPRHHRFGAEPPEIPGLIEDILNAPRS